MLAIGAVVALSTYQAIDEVNEPDFVEMLDECDINDRLGVVNVVDIVVDLGMSVP